jgi:S1-C subfamily serine protease
MTYRKLLLFGVPALLVAASFLTAEGPDPRVRQSEARRVAVIEKVKPAVVAIFSPGGQGGGSGVLIDKEGYALTNFHVVQGSGPVMQCGLPDGVLYDAVLVGLDKVGDVALIKLLPAKPGQQFPFAPMGDSDKVQAGDWSLAMGNPFLLATDFTPTVTYGLVSGVHRYQYPAGVLLEYTDCIQIDTSINPGNSGGPLFNLDGELIGINGRGSFEKRGRVNSGVGYAISINQIKNFLGHLRAGIDTDHATLGATVQSDTDENGVTKMAIHSIIEESDAARRGLKIDDELVSFAGRPVGTVNEYKNALGLYPKGWRVPLVYRRDNKKHEILVRLMGVQRQELDESGRPVPGQPQPQPQPRPRVPGQPRIPQGGGGAATKSPAMKLYEPKPGYANYYFNKQQSDRVLAELKKLGDFSKDSGDWTLEAKFKTARSESGAMLAVKEEKARTLVQLELEGGVKYELDPLDPKIDEKRDGEKKLLDRLQEPPGSGGLLVSLDLYKRLLTLGPKAFERNFGHGGNEPFYPPPADGKAPASLNDLRVDTEVLHGEHGRYVAKYFFSLKDHTLLGMEVEVSPELDPCELCFSDYRPENGRMLPHRIDVRYGDTRYGTFLVSKYRFAAGK